MSEQHAPKPFADLRYRSMKSPAQFLLELFELGGHPFAYGTPKNDELASQGLTAYVGKAKEIKCLRFPLSSTPAVMGRKAAKLDYPSLGIVKFQVEPLKTLHQISIKPLRVFSVLEAYYKVVTKPDDDNLPSGSFPPPLVRP